MEEDYHRVRLGRALVQPMVQVSILGAYSNQGRTDPPQGLSDSSPTREDCGSQRQRRDSVMTDGAHIGVGLADAQVLARIGSLFGPESLGEQAPFQVGTTDDDDQESENAAKNLSPSPAALQAPPKIIKDKVEALHCLFPCGGHEHSGVDVSGRCAHLNHEKERTHTSQILEDLFQELGLSDKVDDGGSLGLVSHVKDNVTVHV